MQPAVIKIKNIFKHSLKGLSLEAYRGEILGIMGASGAGKTTLLRCLMGLEIPVSGQIWIDELELAHADAREWRQARQRLGVIFQHFHLLSSRTVAENISYPLEVLGVPLEERQERVAELLSLVGLVDKADVYPAFLSGGQKQRVGIARAIAHRPEILLCDEATSALDPQTTRSILSLLRSLNKQLGLTILLVSHQMHVIRGVCDRVAVMAEGQIVEVNTASALFAHPADIRTRQLLLHEEI